jgi:hypothetical protein
MHAARPKNLPSRTAVDVSYPIIGKSLITKDRVVMSTVGFYPGVSHVRGDPARMALHEVFSRSILVIGYHDLDLAIGILRSTKCLLQNRAILRNAARMWDD